MRRDGQRCFELQALIRSPLHILTESIPKPYFGQIEQTLTPNTVAEGLQGKINF